MSEVEQRSGQCPTNLYPTKENLEAAYKVTRLARVPHIPHLVLSIREEVAQIEPDIRRIVNLISQDPSLAGKVLKIANSSLYGADVVTESIHQAVVRLGVSQIGNLVTAEAVGALADDVSPEVKRVWESNLEEARAAVAVSAYLEEVNADEAYLLGMMHDIGNIVYARIKESFGVLKDRAGILPVAILEQERQLFGTDHTVIGFLLSRHWKLPDTISLAIYHHHKLTCQHITDSKVRSMVALLKLANYLTSLHLRETELPEMIQYRVAAQKELMLSPAIWQELASDARSGFHW